MLNLDKLGIIGSGNMANAIVRGLLDSKTISRDQIIVSGRNQTSLNSFKEKFGAKVTSNNAECITQSDVVMLAVKPQDFPQVVPTLRSNIKPSKIVVSVMAGISIETIQKTTGINKIVRVMPTIAVSRCQGVLVWAKSSSLDVDESERIRSLLALLGKEIHLDNDSLLDLSATISGCGIAYFYFIVDILIQNGLRLGFSKETSEILAKQTLIGAAASLEEGGKSIEERIVEVASKGGMTEQALEVFRKRGLGAIFSEAVDRAVERAIELSKSATV